MVAVYMLSPDSTVLFWLGVLVAVVLAAAAVIHGLLVGAHRLHARYIRRQIARIEREGLAHLDWHARHSHGGVR